MEKYFQPLSRRPKRNPSKRVLKGIFFIIIIIGIFIWYDSAHYHYVLETAVDPTDTKETSFLVKKGETLNQIAKNLKEKNLTLDEGVFKRYMQINNLDRKVVPGRFLLSKSLTIPQVGAIIIDANKSQVVITIPEGFSVRDIDKKLVELDLIKPQEFAQAVQNFTDYEKYPFLDKNKMVNLVYPLEGYLFPDTYFIDPQNFHSEDLIQLMLKNFKKKLANELEVKNSRNFHDIITMASIIEKEARNEKDLPLVSGILWKRIEKNWMLGADATLLYLKSDHELSAKDLEADSPYNTRKKAGLPPGPICNPGLKSIMAALHPKESPYFYYLTKPNGEMVYAVSNEEHNQNKQKYL